MNKKLIQLLKNRYISSFATILLATAMVFVPGTAFSQDYVGSEFCSTCHEDQYNDWQASGHPWKITSGEQSRSRGIPLPKGYSWDDISYVIGGAFRKIRYIDNEGYIITVTTDENGDPVDGVNQYNIKTGKWSDYHAGEVDKPYNCGQCHTTGWVANPDPTDLTGNQDMMPGMHGTFEFGGIHCEACHGVGMHPAEVDTSAEFCGTCHVRNADPTVIPAKGGFIQHREQGNELHASPHNGMGCVDCHNPHKRSQFSITQECTDACHSGRVEDSYMEHSMADYQTTCVDCHMPFASKSGQSLGLYMGDQKTHIFSIDTDPEANMFTEDGLQVVLDDEGKAAVTMDFACKRCHVTAEMTELSRHAMNFHGKDTTVSQLEYIGLNPGLTGNWWGGTERNGEGFLLEVADAGGVQTLVLSFYTYDSEGNQVWLIAVGPANTGMTANVDVFISAGRKWGEDANPADFTIPFGTAVFTIPSCDVGMFTLTPNATYMAEGFTEIGYDLSRDITTSKIACPTFVNNAN